MATSSTAYKALADVDLKLTSLRYTLVTYYAVAPQLTLDHTEHMLKAYYRANEAMRHFTRIKDVFSDYTRQSHQ